MSFTIRLQRTHPLASPEDIRDDSHVQSIASLVKATYDAKRVPTTPQDVRQALLTTFAVVDMEESTDYSVYIDPKTGAVYYCCYETALLTVSPSADPNPVIVELRSEALVP